MRIDAHQHFWVYDQGEYAWIDDSMASLRSDFLPKDLKIELESKGFQGSVAVQARQTLEETRWRLELATDASFILGVVGWVDLRSSNVRSQLEAFAGNPSWLGFATSCRANQTIDSCCNRNSSGAFPCLKSLISPTTYSSIPSIFLWRRSSLDASLANASFWIILPNR